MVTELFHGATSDAASKGLHQLRGLIQAFGAAASVVLTRALLNPDGRMRLWLGLKALSTSSPMEGRLPAVVKAFTKQRHAFELGVQGSLVLNENDKEELRVPMSRLYTHSSPPEPLTKAPEVGDVVRVRYPYHKPDKADAEEGLFIAVVTAVHAGSVTGGWPSASPSAAPSAEPSASPSAAPSAGPTVASPRLTRAAVGAAVGSAVGLAVDALSSPLSPRRSAQPTTVDIRYTDEVALSFGDQPDTAGLNVLDQIPEVGAMWRLWIRGLSIDVTVPPDVHTPSRRWRRRRYAPSGGGVSPRESASEGATPVGAGAGGGCGDGDEGPPSENARPASRSTSPVFDGASDGGAGATPEGAASKTISVDWAEPSAEEKVAGNVYGSLVFTVSLPLVFIRAHLRSVRPHIPNARASPTPRI